MTNKNKDKNVSAIAQNCTLIRLETKTWSGIKSDPELRDTLAKDYEAQSSSFNVQKYLVGSEHKKQWKSCVDTLRKPMKEFTLPWSDTSFDHYEGRLVSGWRLCPNKHWDKLNEAMEKSQTTFWKEVDGFIRDYPKLIERAKEVLGDAFDEDDYPDLDDIRGKFRFEWSTAQVPDATSIDDVRVKASSSLVKKMKADVTRLQESNSKACVQQLVDNLIEQSEHLSEKLKNYDPKNKRKGGFFKDGSVNLFKDTVGLLPTFNEAICGNDKTITQAHQKLMGVIVKLNSVDDIRADDDKSDKARKEVAQDIDDAIDPVKSGFFDAFKGGEND